MLYYGTCVTIPIISFLLTEQVKLAERTKASDIPLPDLPPSQLGLAPNDIALQRGIPLPFSKGILKKPPG